MTIKLVSVYDANIAVSVLYDLLQERTPEMSISHTAMPTYHRHAHFVRDMPYDAWYLVMDGEIVIGSIYLTRQREVGIFVFRAHQGKGYGSAALAELRRLHPGRMLANINPANEKSIEFFTKRGARLIQHTFELS